MERQSINFKQNFLHPEEEPNVEELNEVFTSAQEDLSYIDETIIKSASNFNDLINNAKMKIENIKEMLNSERERQQDVNILCNKYSEFSSVLNLDSSKFTGNLTFNNNILQALTAINSKIAYDVESIEGNGYEGNDYVYLNEAFLNASIDTSNHNYLKDNNLATNFEYSRITTSNDTEAPSDFNKDSIEAECSILLKAEEEFNHIEIKTDREDLVLKEVYTSTDGLIYHLQKEYNISINNRSELYNDSTYIYGSGIITIEPTKYVKLVFKSNGYTDDQLAFTKAFYDNYNNITSKKIIKVDTARRHVIRLSEISLYKNAYKPGMIISNELISSPVNCIGLYCNEYINDDYTIEKNVSYYLIINGEELEITPLNSHRNGKKIARTSSQMYKAEHVIYLNEKIKTAKLKIVINTTNTNITPYISDIKILIGGV